MRREGPQTPKRESLYTVAEDDVRWMLGDTSDEQWEDAKQIFADLRNEIAQMQWFSAGPNSVSAGKHGENWNELVFAPRGMEHQRHIEELLAKLSIFPWEEIQENVKVLVIENRRDVALLRGGLIFDYLVDQVDRKERERALEVEREKQILLFKERQRNAEKLAERLAAEKAESETIEREREERAEIDRQWNIKIDTEGAEFRKMLNDERERRIAGLFAALPHTPREEFERPLALPQDHFYRFGYTPTTKRASPIGRAPAIKQDSIVDEVLDVDTQTLEFIEDFDEGKINEDALAQDALGTRAIGTSASSPNMVLFPKKYEWVKEPRVKGFLRNRNSQRVVPQQEIEEVVVRAKEGDENTRAETIRELSLMHRALILYLIREERERHSAAVPDDLMQACLQGLVYAVDHFNPELTNGGDFKSYMIPCMKGFMRRISPAARFGVMRTPINVSSERKKVIEAEQALRHAHPERPVETEEMASALNSQGIIKDDSIGAYDAYIRKILSVYEEVGVDQIDSESVQLHDVDMRGEDRYQKPEQIDVSELRSLQDAIQKGLLRLTPREERALRMYEELSVQETGFSSSVYRTLQGEFLELLPGINENDVKERIRSLTALGNLKDPEILNILSQTDRALALRYVELVTKDDATLESVGLDFGVTRERVRQIMAKAVRKLKKPSSSRKLAPFLENY